jgi:hypothetical protein
VIGYEHFDSTEKFLYELEKRPIIRGICGRAKSSESPGGTKTEPEKKEAV